jgi:hypothetical protein
VPGNGRGRAPAGLAFRPYSLGSSRTDAGRPAPRGVRPSPGAVSACTGSGLALQSGPCPVSPPCPPSLTSRPAEPSRSGLASTPNSPQFSVRSNSIFGARLPPPGNPARRSKQSRRVQPRPGVGALGLEADRHTIRAFSLVACPLHMRCGHDRSYIGQDIRQVQLAYGPPADAIDLGNGVRAYQWTRVSLSSTPITAPTTARRNKKGQDVSTTQVVGMQQTVDRDACTHS